MAIQKEIWVDYIIANLFKDNEFLNYAFDAGMYVVNGAVVHIPQAGAPSDVKRNRTALPATIKQRQDVDVTYALDEFTTDPRLIVAADKVELSYDKIGSVLQEDLAAIKEIIAEWMIYKWLANAKQLRTNGGAVAAHLPSATGNRKALLASDLKAARKEMNKLGIPKEDRYALIDSDMYDQLTTDATFNSSRDAIKDMNLPAGTIAYLYGFYIMERATVARYNNASTPELKTPDAAAAATDNAAVLCWQKNEVEKAMGTVDYFEKLNDPTFYGDVYSMLCRMGGRSRRNSNPGVVAIIQEVHNG